MDVQQLHARQGNSAGYGALDGIRNVVKFQVQEYTRAKLAQFCNRGRALRSE